MIVLKAFLAISYVSSFELQYTLPQQIYIIYEQQIIIIDTTF